MNQPEGLISVLLDKSAREDERDDAAMDLSKYPCDKSIEALLKVATDSSEEEYILDSCGESLGIIWVKRNRIDGNIIQKLTERAYLSAKQHVKGYKPEWLIYFYK